MKFDFVIGNPPYQLETAKIETENGQKTRTNIFQYFQLEADKIVNEGSVLIYPAKRWIHQSGKGLKSFGKEQINDVKLKKLIYYDNSREVFKDADITDGISVVLKNQNKKINGFEYTYIESETKTTLFVDNPGEDLMPINPKDFEILNKIDYYVKYNGLCYMHDTILPRSLFGIESDFVEKNKEHVRPYVNDEDIDFRREVKLLSNDKAGSAGRSKWFVINRSAINQNQEHINKWKVVVSSAHPGGQYNRDNCLEIVDNNSAFGRARVALKSFNSFEEANNFYKYVSSNLIKYTFLMTDEALTSLGKRVPDLIYYSDNQKLIDFCKNIDEQLYKAIRISSDEVAYIESRLK